MILFYTLRALGELWNPNITTGIEPRRKSSQGMRGRRREGRATLWQTAQIWNLQHSNENWSPTLLLLLSFPEWKRTGRLGLLIAKGNWHQHWNRQTYPEGTQLCDPVRCSVLLQGFSNWDLKQSQENELLYLWMKAILRIKDKLKT